MRALTLSLAIAGLVACLPPSIIFLATATAQTDPARKAEADRLIDQAYELINRGEFQKGTSILEEAVKIYRSIGDRDGEAISLGNLGIAYSRLGQYQQALAIFKQIGDRDGEVQSLYSLGRAYYRTGQYQQAIEFDQQALAIIKQIGDRQGEAHCLYNLANSYYGMGQYQRGIQLHQQAIAIYRQIGDRNREAISINHLGVGYHSLGQYQRAIEFHQQAFAIYRRISDRKGEALSLHNLGDVYKSLGQYQRAIEFYQQSFTVIKQTGDRHSEAKSHSDLAYSLESQKLTDLAIIHLKQAVNIYEAIRGDIKGLGKETQRSFVGKIEDAYRLLSNLLLKQGRITEALQVLDLLKVQELEDYFKAFKRTSATEKGVPLLAPEQGLVSRLLSNLTSEQYAQLNQQLSASIKQLSPTALNPIPDTLRQLPQDSALLYPVVLDARLELVLFIPNQPPINRTINIKPTDLDKLIKRFREDLRDPTSNDVLESSKKLYDLFFKPIEADLAKAGVKTILYAPDKQLRYIPLSALYDGKQWLIEKYQIAYLISYNLANFNPAVRTSPRILAGALGNQKVAGLAPLPATLPEVEAIRRSLPDTQTLVERSFTAPAVQKNLQGRSILHFATHAEFNPSNPNLSYVLMGDGNKLTLPELRQWNLRGIDLVVLSACQTGVGGFGQGIEILGFGYQMQLAGAKSTLSSLWSVSDGGTKVLMDSFYNSFAQRRDGIVALREAQIAMIRKGDNLSPERKRGFEVLRSALPAKVQGKLDHPFYWSPFIIIVNQF